MITVRRFSGVPIAASNDGSTVAHSSGATPLLTGSSNDPADPDGWSLTDSVDALLEPVSAKAGLPFGAYRCQAFPQTLQGADSQARRVCIKNAKPIPLQSDPSTMCQELFAGRSLGAAAQPAAGTRPESVSELRVLNATHQATQALRAKLDRPSQRQLDAYLDSLSEIERSLSAAGGVATAYCADPGATSLGTAGDHRDVDLVAEAQIDMLAMAMACDLTRVGFFQLSGAGGGGDSTSDLNYGAMLGTGGHARGHHMLTHEWEQAGRGLEQIEEALGYTFSLAARLATKLDSFAEGDGTALDHTVILMATETAGNVATEGEREGSIHRQSGHDMRAVIIGGSDYFNLGGRELQFTASGPFYNEQTNGEAIAVSDTNPTNNRLLLHLLRYMGDDRETIGLNPDYSRGGPLPGLAK